MSLIEKVQAIWRGRGWWRGEGEEPFNIITANSCLILDLKGLWPERMPAYHLRDRLCFEDGEIVQNIVGFCNTLDGVKTRIIVTMCVSTLMK